MVLWTRKYLNLQLHCAALLITQSTMKQSVDINVDSHYLEQCMLIIIIIIMLCKIAALKSWILKSPVIFRRKCVSYFGN